MTKITRYWTRFAGSDILSATVAPPPVVDVFKSATGNGSGFFSCVYNLQQTTEGINMEGFSNSGQIVDIEDADEPSEIEPSAAEKALVNFIITHTDQWREYRDANFMDDYLKYERVWRGKWEATDKTRESERSKVISPATQQAIETRHAEIMEAIFGQGEFFDISDDLADQNGQVDVEKIKKQLNEDFKQDKIRKAIDQVALLAEIYGTGIAEVVVSSQKQYKPAQMPIDSVQMAYGTMEKDRISCKLVPVNPKNFIFDPNGTEIDDCMGVAIEKYVSIHKVAEGIASGKYRDVDISSMYETDELEPTQESQNFQNNKVKLLTYYGLVPRAMLDDGTEFEDLGMDDNDADDYEDMVECIIVIGNGDVLLKAEENPYMMKDRPVLSYQADTVPNRLPGRGTAEKAYNMQMAVDGSMRSHMDALALTVAPMVGLDATRLPRGAKFEVKPGKAFLTNGAPQEIIFPFKFGTNDGQAMQTSKEFERMLLMATSTVDSAGAPSQVSRDAGGIDMSTATMIKKYKRVLVNFQEDFLIPFIYKAVWRFMQFDPERYPAVDVKFIPTGTLGIVAREYEQKQLAFLIQTLGAQSPLTPILMQSIIKNSSLTNREEMLVQLQKASQPNPQQQAMQQQGMQIEMQKGQAEVALKMAQAEKAKVEAQLAPEEVKARMISALANNLDEDAEGADFERRVRLTELMLKEREIESNEKITEMQTVASAMEKQAQREHDNQYMQSVGGGE